MSTVSLTYDAGWSRRGRRALAQTVVSHQSSNARGQAKTRPDNITAPEAVTCSTVSLAAMVIVWAPFPSRHYVGRSRSHGSDRRHNPVTCQRRGSRRLKLGPLWCSMSLKLLHIVEKSGENPVDNSQGPRSEAYVSPYLLSPLRSLDEVLQERETEPESGIRQERREPAQR